MGPGAGRGGSSVPLRGGGCLPEPEDLLSGGPESLEPKEMRLGETDASLLSNNSHADHAVLLAATRNRRTKRFNLRTDIVDPFKRAVEKSCGHLGTQA